MQGEERGAAGKSAEERKRGRNKEGETGRVGRKERQREKLERKFQASDVCCDCFLSLAPSMSLSLCLALNGRDVACICRQEGTQFGTIYSAVSALMHLRDRE